MKLSFVILTCALLILTGCSKNPTIQPVTNSSVVVAFGDSLTAGCGAETAESYPAILAERLGCRVINAGISGEVSSDGYRRLPGILAKYKPSLVILCHGGNDLLQQCDFELIANNIDLMVEQIQNTGADVFLIGVPKPGLLLKSASFYRAIAKKHNVPFDGDTLPDILSTPALKSDKVHPGPAGYRKLAEAIAEKIRNSEQK